MNHTSNRANTALAGQLIFLGLLSSSCSIIDGINGEKNQQADADAGLPTVVGDTGVPTNPDGGIADGGFQDAGFVTPSIEFTESPPAEYTRSTTASFAFSYSPDDAILSCDGMVGIAELSLPACKSPIELENLTEAKYSITITVTVNETLSSSITHSWNVDLTPPSIIGLMGPTSIEDLTTDTSTATFSFDSSEENSSYECKINQEAWFSCSSGYSRAFARGKHEFFVRAIDRAGNQGLISRWAWAYGRFWKKLAASEASTCGIKEDGSLWCWGRNDHGELGNNTFHHEHTPQLVTLPGASTSTVWTDITGGESHFCAIDGAKDAWCWGENSDDRLGFDSATNNFENIGQPSTAVAGNHQWTSIKASKSGTCGLTIHGELYCWGEVYGSSILTTPTRVESFGVAWTRFVQGRRHICALTANGELYCWGQGTSGQLGDGTETSRTDIGAPLPNLSFADIAANSGSTCGVTTANELYCWGDYYSNGLNQGNSNATTPTQLGTDTDWTRIYGAGATTGLNFCAQKVTGATYCWGLNRAASAGTGEFGRLVTTSTASAVAGFSDFVFGDRHGCALDQVGSLYCWGSNEFGQLQSEEALVYEPRELASPIPGGEWSTMDTGSLTNCGIVDSLTMPIQKSVWCWGVSNEILGDGNGLYQSQPVQVTLPAQENWSKISVHAYNAFVFTQDPQISPWSWGYYDPIYYQVSWGRSSTTAFGQIAGNLGLRALSSQSDHTCGIATYENDSIWCWGGSSTGNSNASYPQVEPIQIELPTSSVAVAWRQVSAGRYYTCAINQNSELWCWGSNRSSQIAQIATGAPRSYPLPTHIQTSDSWLKVAAGSYETCGLRDDEQLWCWDANGNREIGHPTGGTWKKIRKGMDNTCAIDEQNHLWCWGSDIHGQLPNYDVLMQTTFPKSHYSSNPVKVDNESWTDAYLGFKHICGLRTDNTLWCWGSNSYGQLGIGEESLWTIPRLRP